MAHLDLRAIIFGDRTSDPSELQAVYADEMVSPDAFGDTIFPEQVIMLYRTAAIARSDIDPLEAGRLAGRTPTGLCQ